MKKRDKSKTMDAKDTDIFAKRSGYIYTEYMTPAIYTTLSYDQKLTYIRQVFVSASATHPVYAKMLHLITGREIQEQYLDMLYDAIHTGINAKTSEDIVAKMGALAVLIEDIRRREQADRIQEEARLIVLEQELEKVATY